MEHASDSELPELMGTIPIATGSNSSAKKKWSCVLCSYTGHHRSREKAHYKTCHQSNLYTYGLSNPSGIVHGMVCVNGNWICPSCCTVSATPLPAGGRRDHTALCLQLWTKGVGEADGWNVAPDASSQLFSSRLSGVGAFPEAEIEEPLPPDIERFVDAQLKAMRDEIQKQVSIVIDERLKAAKRTLQAIALRLPEGVGLTEEDDSGSPSSRGVSGVKRKRGANDSLDGNAARSRRTAGEE